MRIVIAVFTSVILSGQASVAASGYPRISEGALERAFTGYLQAWSSEGRITPASMGRFYAEHVVYYGKPMSREQVFADKLRYIEKWPERRYSIVPGTLSIHCNSSGTVCQTRGLMHWDRRSATGQRSVGTARLTLTASQRSGGKIVRESAFIEN